MLRKRKKQTVPPETVSRPDADPELEPIADLEQRIVAAFDFNHVFWGTAPEEVARLRPDVVTLATRVCDQLREEHLARRNRGA